MRPFLFGGDVIEVAPIVSQVLCVGDVVVIRIADDCGLAHRIVRIRRVGNQMKLDLKGDAMPSCDRQMDPAQVLGIVVAVERAGRRIALDRGWLKIIGRAWAWVSPVRPATYRLLRWLWRVWRHGPQK
jgi:hypothetical protein